MDFLGKWTIKADGAYVTLNQETGQLDMSGTTEGAVQKFNAYGTNNQFMLQAANGKYIATSDAGYQANLARAGAVTYFKLEAGTDGAVRILDLGVKGAGPEQFYWNAVSNQLQRLKTTGDLPATTNFSQTILTVGLQDILDGKFPDGGNDLAWAYLAEVDFRNVLGFFTQANLQHATLTKANFDSVDLSKADLSNADLQYATIRGMSADLSGARLDDADLSNADLSNATITSNATFLRTKLVKVSFQGATIESVDFSHATLTSADFTGATVSGCNFTAADLTGANLSNPAPNPPKTLTSIDLSKATGTQFSAATNFANAQLRYNNLRGFDFSNVVMNNADLTGCQMDNTILVRAELSYANLTNVTLTGNINMHGVNLSNAILAGVDMTGAQLGGISLQFFVPDGNPDFTKLLNGLKQDDIGAVTAIFVNHQVPLQGNIIINTSPGASDRVWTVERTKPAQTTFTVRLETLAGAQALRVYQSATTAILTNAYMKGAILTSANLYNVRASGVQLYGGARLDGDAILEGIQFDRANLAGINLSQARMYGANLDYANLVNANLQGAYLTPSADGGQVTLNSTQLQGADFTDSHLDEAIFTDAAVSISLATDPNPANGVWLFDAAVDDANLCVPELTNASPGFQLNQFSDELETLLPALTPGRVSTNLVAAYDALSPKITIDPDSLLTVLTSDTYWQVTDGSQQYVIFHTCDKYTTVLGIAKGAAFTTHAQCTFPLTLERELRGGAVTEALVTAFQKQGISLSRSATLTMAHQATDFQIVQPQGPSYTLWFGLQSGEASCGYGLFTRQSIHNVIALFANHSVPLSTRTTVSNVGNTLWNVINDDENPFNPVTNYIEFFVCRNPDQTLSIYGSFLRVLRSSATNGQEYYNFPCALTTLMDNQFQTNTICPNSVRKSVNQTNNLPFAQWMRARSLPKAPFCIPDPSGMFDCPQ